jgi:hypothetical protein
MTKKIDWVIFIVNVIFLGIPLFFFMDLHEKSLDDSFGLICLIGLLCIRFTRVDMLEMEVDELKRKLDGKK